MKIIPSNNIIFATEECPERPSYKEASPRLLSIEMLRSLIIMASSGIVVFEKSWDKQGAQRELANQWGGLVRAVIEFSKQSVGLPMSYLEAGDTALSVATDPKTGVICTLFHSAGDSSEFGSLLSHEILRTFQESYPSVDFTKLITDKGQFSGFGAKIVDCIKNVIDAVLLNLASRDGIEATLLIYDDGTESITYGALQDKISVIANCKAFLTSCNQAVVLKKDTPNFVRIDVVDQVIYIHRLRNIASMVTLCSRKLAKNYYFSHVARAFEMLNRVYRLLSYYT